MDVLVAATDNFSETNPFGRGGFGTVYKVVSDFFLAIQFFSYVFFSNVIFLIQI